MVEPETLKAISGFPPLKRQSSQFVLRQLLCLSTTFALVVVVVLVYLFFICSLHHIGENGDLNFALNEKIVEGNQDIRSSIIWMKGTHR